MYFTYNTNNTPKNSIGLEKQLILTNHRRLSLYRQLSLIKKKMVIFSNCHGNYFKQIFERNTNICSLFDITYIVSYLNVNNFEEIKIHFQTADIILITPITYVNFKIENVSKIIKPTCKLIKIPFVRFDGFWLEDTFLDLNKFKTNTIKDFPYIDIEDISHYLEKEYVDLNMITEHFTNSINKMKQIEDSCDIKFVSFFISIYKKFPTFMDSYHPTENILNFIASQLIDKINDYYPINSKFKYSLQLLKGNGHFKPIQNNIKKILEIEYDLDSYYPICRKDFLFKILEYDGNKSNENINNHDELYQKVFGITFNNSY